MLTVGSVIQIYVRLGRLGGWLPHMGTSHSSSLRGAVGQRIIKSSLNVMDVESGFGPQKWICQLGPSKLTSAWRIIPFSKWLITMVSESPKWGYSPSKWPKWLMILQVGCRLLCKIHFCDVLFFANPVSKEAVFFSHPGQIGRLRAWSLVRSPG